MTHPRKELLAGAVLITIISCFFIEILVSGYRNNIAIEVPKLSNLVINLLGWYLTIFSIGIIGLAMYLVVKNKSKMSERFDKFTVRAIIPGPYFLAIVPVGMGFIIFTITQNINWGGYLACLSFPTIAIMVILSIWKK